ncbi:hypothetical protein K432DRAFT_285480 [Lepidopterella palustris CBS 459.81]|uniref:BZIP domain-containing protein n=1 Tax=Lepidopterella palustris CBS 459.81 TaxID=1314670 RepID=A0A8E2EM54_9PEZI|nr:hypothetical protein K432DRAFT_285480 [Lepidopterella palustris CBS 459.81]
MHSFPLENQHEAQGGTGIFLPPLRQISHTPPTPSSDRSRSGRPLGVQSILNPQLEMTEQQRGRRRSAAQMESPSPIDTTPAQSLPSLSRPTSVDSAAEDLIMGRPYPGPGKGQGQGQGQGQSRHILSPRSPALHRTQSLGVLKPPTGTIDAHQSPFLNQGANPGARIYTAEPGTSGVPLMPTSPAIQRAGFDFTRPSAPTPPPGFMRTDPRRRSMGFAQSGSASPITSYSPYSQPAQLSSGPPEQTGTNLTGSYATARGSTPGPQQFNNPPVSMGTERNFMSMPSTGQSSYQLLTVQTQGGNVQIPVEVNAASKASDEKRKRNAGASARFRARRKEKEMQASSTISKLEQQIRDATEDVEFYKRERDYFMQIVYNQPGGDRHFPRQSSPRHRRVSVPSTGPPSTSGSGSGPYSGFSEPPEHRETDRNVRRRTSSYLPVSAPAPAPQSGPGSQQQPYTTSGFPSIVPAPQPGQLLNRGPRQHPDPRDQRQLPETPIPQQSSQRPPFRDPFASEPKGYDRSWPPVPGREGPRQ